MNKLIIEASCEVDGVEYHAETSGPEGGCVGCAGDSDRGRICLRLGPCGDTRQDRSSIIWVRAE
jgi:hypothetical protein